MLRKTLTIFALIGLLLSVGAWGASLVSVAIYRVALPWSLTVWVDNGALQFHNSKLAQDVIQKLGISNGITWEYGARLRTMSAMGRWYWWLGYMSDNQTFSTTIIPLYLPVLLFGVWPAWLLLPFRRRRKRKKLGLCVQCGYDLRASKDRCPECGQEFETS